MTRLNSLILDFQNDINNSDIKIEDILRKSLVIATKLNINDFIDWINLELGGYGEKDEIPKYRIINGDLRLSNDYQKDIPVAMDSTKIYESIQSTYIPNSIIEIEDLCSSDNNLKLIPPIEKRNVICKYFPDMSDYEIYLIFNNSQFKAIVGAVRTKLLNWYFKLEKDGIMGKNSSFSDEELEIANKNDENYKFIITNSNVQFGDNNTQIVNNFKNISLEMKNLKTIIKGSDLGSDVKINNEIETIDNELVKDIPNINIIKKSLHFLEDIFKRVISNVIAQQALVVIFQILAYISNNFN